MTYALNLVYVLLLAAFSPWLAWAAIRKGKYRQGWSTKLWGYVPILAPSERRRIWFHAVSVGEVNLLEPILVRLISETPDVDVIITTTTKTGFELASKKYTKHSVHYCPLDFSWAVERVLQSWRPDLLVLVELELWPNLLLAARKRSIPIAIVNARLSDASVRGYLRLRKWFPGFSQRVLDCLNVIAAQSRTCAERFEQLGISPDRIVLHWID